MDSTFSPISSLAAAGDLTAVDQLAGELRQFERLLSAAYAAGGRLASAAIAVQQERKLSVVAGHQVLTAISAANGEVSEAIARSAEVHRLVERTARALGIFVEEYGDEHKMPGPGAEAGPLRVAA